MRAAEIEAEGVIAHVSEEAGIDRGVCCMLGFDAEVALQVVRSGDFLLHIRDADPDAVGKVRELADQAGLGIDRVVVDRGSAEHLPYADNMIDLLLATNVSEDQLAGLSVDEVLRVLRPEGAGSHVSAPQAGTPLAFPLG